MAGLVAGLPRTYAERHYFNRMSILSDVLPACDELDWACLPKYEDICLSQVPLGDMPLSPPTGGDIPLSLFGECTKLELSNEVLMPEAIKSVRAKRDYRSKRSSAKRPRSELVNRPGKSPAKQGKSPAKQGKYSAKRPRLSSPEVPCWRMCGRENPEGVMCGCEVKNVRIFS